MQQHHPIPLYFPFFSIHLSTQTPPFPFPFPLHLLPSLRLWKRFLHHSLLHLLLNPLLLLAPLTLPPLVWPFLFGHRQILHRLVRLLRVLTGQPDLRPKFVEQEWKRHACQRQKRRNAACPVDAKTIIHVRREKWEDRAKERSQDGVGSEHRSGVDGVGIDEVVHDREEHKDHPEAEGRGENYRDAPVDAWVVRPRKDE